MPEAPTTCASRTSRLGSFQRYASSINHFSINDSAFDGEHFRLFGKPGTMRAGDWIIVIKAIAVGPARKWPSRTSTFPRRAGQGVLDHPVFDAFSSQTPPKFVNVLTLILIVGHYSPLRALELSAIRSTSATFSGLGTSFTSSTRASNKK